MPNFRIQISSDTLVAIDIDLWERVAEFVKKDAPNLELFHRFDRIYDYYYIEGEASTEAITVLQAVARGDDVEKLLNMFEKIN